MPSFQTQHTSFAQLTTPPYDRQNYFDSMLYYTPWQSATRDERDTHNNPYTERQPAYKPNPSAPLFQPKQALNSTFGSHVDRVDQYINAPALPPIQSYHKSLQPPQAVEAPKAREEQSAGGLVKHLDYDLKAMVDYLFDSTLATYTPQLCLPRTQLPWSDFLDSVHKNAKPVAAEFRDWLRHVLSATRLPSTTIFFALNYLAKRVEKFEGRALFRQEQDVKRMFIVSLILASKYADDSTFINRSWADVAKIDIEVINYLELEWLQLIDWHLDVKVNPEWENYRTQFKRFELNRSFRGLAINNARLNPLNTNLPPPPAMTATPTRSYAMSAQPTVAEQPGSAAKRTKLYHESYSAAPLRYGPWNPPRLTSDLSPDSAPYTGPATPEFYAGHWTQPPSLNAMQNCRLPPPATYSQWSQPAPYQALPQIQSFAQPYIGMDTKYEDYNAWNPSPPSHSHQNMGHCMRCPPGLGMQYSHHNQAVYA